MVERRKAVVRLWVCWCRVLVVVCGGLILREVDKWMCFSGFGCGIQHGLEAL